MRRQLLAFVLGLLLPLAGESLVYAAAAGDPFLPWTLSLGHTRIPSSELASSVDLSQSPLLNIAYIDGWVPSMGIAAHWSVEALINLLAHPDIGLTLTCGIFLIGLNWRQLGSEAAGGKLLPFLIGAAMLLFGALVYGLAVDPKPRMFLAVAAVASLCFGVLAARGWRVGSRLMVLVCMPLLLTKAALEAYDRPDLHDAGALAGRWVAQEPAGTISVTALTSRFLTLTPEVRTLPLYQEGRSDRVLLVGPVDCGEASRKAGFGHWTVQRSHSFDSREPRLIELLRAHRLFLNTRFVPALCLLRRPATADTARP